jgi:hypothetical protein
VELADPGGEVLTGVAVEEMLHLALVANVMTAIGAAPMLSRPNFPRQSEYLPSGVRFALSPGGTAWRAGAVHRPAAQATPEMFRWPQLIAVTGLASARAAIDEIIEQGEGARGTGSTSCRGGLPPGPCCPNGRDAVGPAAGLAQAVRWWVLSGNRSSAATGLVRICWSTAYLMIWSIIARFGAMP